MGNCPVASVSILGSCFKPFVRVDKQPLESKTNVADKFEVVLQGIDFIVSGGPIELFLVPASAPRLV